MSQIEVDGVPEDTTSTTITLKKANWIAEGAFTKHVVSYTSVRSKPYRNEKKEIDNAYIIVFFKTSLAPIQRILSKNSSLKLI
jgi:hypothetical protein